VLDLADDVTKVGLEADARAWLIDDGVPELSGGEVLSELHKSA